MDSKNSKRIEDELSEENIGKFNVYDVVVDFMILDSLADLDCLPSAILSVTKSRFITRSLRENVFNYVKLFLSMLGLLYVGLVLHTKQS